MSVTDFFARVSATRRAKSSAVSSTTLVSAVAELTARSPRDTPPLHKTPTFPRFVTDVFYGST